MSCIFSEDYRIWPHAHTLVKLGLYDIVMTGFYRQEDAGMRVSVLLMLRDGQVEIYKPRGDTHGRYHAHDGGNCALIVLYEAGPTEFSGRLII